MRQMCVTWATPVSLLLIHVIPLQGFSAMWILHAFELFWMFCWTRGLGLSESFHFAWLFACFKSSLTKVFDKKLSWTRVGRKRAYHRGLMGLEEWPQEKGSLRSEERWSSPRADFSRMTLPMQSLTLLHVWLKRLILTFASTPLQENHPRSNKPISAQLFITYWKHNRGGGVYDVPLSLSLAFSQSPQVFGFFANLSSVKDILYVWQSSSAFCFHHYWHRSLCWENFFCLFSSPLWLLLAGKLAHFLLLRISTFFLLPQKYLCVCLSEALKLVREEGRHRRKKKNKIKTL